jgi:hypothetical protein
VVAASVVGGLVASRRPQNPMGWVLCGFSVFRGVSALAAGYAYVAPGGAGAGVGQLAAWLATWSFVALFALAIFVHLLFPDGLLPGRRWRVAAWGGGAGVVALATGTALDPGPLSDYPDVTNPLGVDDAAAGALVGTGALVTLAVLVAAVASVVVRYRRADETHRQQIKWLALAGFLAVASALVGTAIALAGAEGIGYSLTLLGILAIPVAIGIAILRHRLYDVDRVISRSLTYALVSVTLAGAYAGLVLAGQALFSAMTGGSGLTIAVSTLLVAALALPLRARVQKLVDRRFNRRRYDAQRTLDGFGARLRDEVDLGTLTADLRGVVDETMQPAHVSVWLRGARP